LTFEVRLVLQHAHYGIPYIQFFVSESIVNFAINIEHRNTKKCGVTGVHN